jgi:putative SOS response-associated peptidase YedK
MARMCGRYTLHTDPSILAELFGLEESPFLAPRYNIAPTQPAAIVRLDPHSKKREWALVQWGLVPSWSKDPTIGARLINARSETVAEKPSFRAAFRRRRCLAPADGFYEWQKSGRRKQPLYITLQDGRPFAIAALWERWVGADGSEIDSCTLLTTEANELMEPIHNRMPVILDPRDYDLWLGGGSDASPREQEELMHLLRPYPAEEMAAVPVSTYVNNAMNEGERCIEPLEPDDGGEH